MEIAIIHHRRQPPWSAQMLIEAAVRLGHTPVYTRIQDLDAGIVKGEIQVTIHGNPAQFQAAVVRGIGLSFTLESFIRRMDVIQALSRKVTVINNIGSIVSSRDKWITLLVLAENNIPVPDTYISENPFTASRLAEKYGKIIYKPITGSLGLGSTLIENSDIAFQVAKTLLAFNQPLYLQQYVEKPGYDIRVFTIGERVFAAMKRMQVQGWKTNIAQGARGVELREKEDPEAFELAVKTAGVLRLDYAGIDIVIDKNTGKHMVIEANAFPLWRGLMEATGRNPAPEIIRHLVSKARK